MALPTHDELMLQSLVEKGMSGRRSLPSELEKALVREKETLEVQLTRARAELGERQQALQQALSTQHRDSAASDRELLVLRQKVNSETATHPAALPTPCASPG